MLDHDPQLRHAVRDFQNIHVLRRIAVQVDDPIGIRHALQIVDEKLRVPGREDEVRARANPPETAGSCRIARTWSLNAGVPGFRCPARPTIAGVSLAMSSTHWLSSSQGLASTTTVPTMAERPGDLHELGGKHGAVQLRFALPGPRHALGTRRIVEVRVGIDHARGARRPFGGQVGAGGRGRKKSPTCDGRHGRVRGKPGGDAPRRALESG